MSEAISVYVRDSTFLPELPPIVAATVDWYQGWDPSGKGRFVALRWYSTMRPPNGCCRDRFNAIPDSAQQLHQ